tara:strand:- start:75 stop:221 length:147 start_codon:yes stop_codon:yes gene_type:complete
VKQGKGKPQGRSKAISMKLANNIKSLWALDSLGVLDHEGFGMGGKRQD